MGRQRPLPAGPLGGESYVQSTGACTLLSGGGCFINEPIERVQAGGLLSRTVGSTLGSQPGERDVESEDPSLRALRLVIRPPTGLGGGVLDRWIRVPALAHGWFTRLASLFHLHGLASSRTLLITSPRRLAEMDQS